MRFCACPGSAVNALRKWRVRPHKRQERQVLYYLPDLSKYRNRRDDKQELSLNGERARLVAAQADKKAKECILHFFAGPAKTDDSTPAKRHAAMTWAPLVKRVFKIDITSREECGGTVKVVASIDAPVVIKQILIHPERKAVSKEFNPLLESRAPPQIGLFG